MVCGLLCRLAAKIWKFVSIRLTTAILMEVPAYQSIRQEKIKYTLERSFVPDLSSFRVFAVNDMMEDIVLLEGIAMDYNTRDAYLAPCYIPRYVITHINTLHFSENEIRLLLRTVQKIALFNKNSLETSEKRLDTKLLIIPMVDVEDYEIMELGVEMSEMVRFYYYFFKYLISSFF